MSKWSLGVVFCFFAWGLAAATDAEPPELRLDGKTHPTRYAIDLTLVPEAETFSGSVTIDLELSEATSLLWLHAADIEVRTASLSFGSKNHDARVLDESDEFLGLALDNLVGPGSAQVVMEYEGQLPKDESSGLFRRQVGDDWYIFSQLEPSDARRVFPGFDEPGFKVPFRMSVTVKQEDRAFFNTPIESESDAGDGMKTVKFQETLPLPTYLLALGVGPLEIVDAGTAGRKETRIRIITPRGQQRKAQYAAEATGPILELMEEYFGSAYPYEKLDQIAVLNFGGAMEHPGLVTYGQTLILSKPEEDTIRRQRGFASVCAHELAHMWFGNLVTMAWWDDTWLNEAFASWMANKIIDQWKPDWDTDVSTVRRRGGAMSADSLDTARKIRQPIESSHDISGAFDGITYSKGASVLSMFEAWMGEDKFRDGVRSYLNSHLHGNASAGDFLAALEGAGGKQVASAFSTFLDQNGVPLVTASLDCETGGRPAVTLSQRRYLPAGSQADAARNWHIPACVEYGYGKTVGRECGLITDDRVVLRLQSAERCPDWVLPNLDMAGYYRVEYSGEMLDDLLRGQTTHLSLAERIGVIDDMRAMVRAGAMTHGDALSRVPALLKDRNRHIVSSTVGIVASVEGELVPDELRPSYARFVRDMYGKRARGLGWAVRPNDDEDTRLLRPTMLGLVAGDGEDPKLIAEASGLAHRWLDDREAVDPEMVGVVLSVAARNGDAQLWQRFYDQARTTTDERDRRRLLGALGGFRDPEIVKKNLAILMSDEFPIFEVGGLLFGALGEPKTRSMAYSFIKDNYDAVVAKLPRGFAGFLPRTAGFFCDEEHAKDAQEFFGPRVDELEGGPRALDQTLERIRLCVANREAQQPSVAGFLAQY